MKWNCKGIERFSRSFLQNHQKQFILLDKNSAQSQIKRLPWVECFYISQLFRWNKVGCPHYEGYQKASTKLTSPKAVGKLALTCHKIFSSFSFSVFFSSADQIFSFSKYLFSVYFSGPHHLQRPNICLMHKFDSFSISQFHLLRSPNIFEIF